MVDWRVIRAIEMLPDRLSFYCRDSDVLQQPTIESSKPARSSPLDLNDELLPSLHEAVLLDVQSDSAGFFQPTSSDNTGIKIPVVCVFTC